MGEVEAAIEAFGSTEWAHCVGSGLARFGSTGLVHFGSTGLVHFGSTDWAHGLFLVEGSLGWRK